MPLQWIRSLAVTKAPAANFDSMCFECASHVHLILHASHAGHIAGINQIVHDRLALHLVALRSPPSEPAKQANIEALKPMVAEFAESHDFKFCDSDELQLTRVKDGKCEEQCLEFDDAVQAVWRLEDEHRCLLQFHLS
eukprot:SAG31_NODE_21618_length_545_cov_0.905830_2_plen_138_part_00